MRGTIQIEYEIFDGGPPFRVQRSLGLIKPGLPRVAWRAELAVLIGWIPLMVIVSIEELLLRNGVAKSFFFDFAVHARFLIAAPLLILAESDCIPRLGSVVRHFLDTGLVIEPDRARFYDAVASTRRLLDSKVAEVVTGIAGYGLVIALWLQFPHERFPAWYGAGGSGFSALSLAGWWHALVSVPLLIILFLGWLWRVLLWGRFLWLMRRLDLQLIPGHPDHAGGLLFVSSSLRAFWLLSFAFGTVVAGMVANRVVHNGASPAAFKNVVIGLVVFVLILFAGPLTVFTNKLRAAKRRGTFDYGALAGDVGRQFEQKWVNNMRGTDEGVLGVQDFSATTDLYSIVANVYEMKDIPFGLKNLGYLIVAALLPFAPVALMVIPFKVIVEGLAKLLL